MFAAGVLAMLVMTGVVVDGGNLFQNRQSLQNAADAAAMGAALEIAKGDCPNPTVGSGCTAAANYAGTYAGFNFANGPNGTSTASDPLPLCNQSGHPGLAVTDTQAPTQAPGCYLYPYVDSQGQEHDDEVEVWLTRNTSNFFGGILGIPTSTESARAVASLTAGTPPNIAFLSLNNDASCQNHTLFISNSGILTVNNDIYTNTCNANDGFDIQGAGAILTATDIFVNQGWENRAGTQVIIPVGGIVCPLRAGQHAASSSDPPGCPHTGAGTQPDPFAKLPAPPLASPGLNPPGTITYSVTKTAISNATTATLTTSPNNHVLAGTQIHVSVPDTRFVGTDGNFTATAGGGAAGGATLSYTIPPVMASMSQTSAAAGVVTVTMSSAPFETNDTVSIDSPLAYADTSLKLSATNFNAGTLTLTDTDSTFKNSLDSQNLSWTRSGNSITANTASPHGLRVGDAIKVTGAPGGGSCSTGGANPTFQVTAVTSNTFMYAVPASCAAGSSGNQLYNFQLWNAALAPASGTVTLQTMPAINSTGGTVLAAGNPTQTSLTAGSCPGASPCQLQPGTYDGGICIGLATGTACNDANCAAALTTQSYGGTQPTLSGAISATQKSFAVTQQKVSAGDVINIGTEDMLVTAVSPIGATGQTLTVDRGYLSATPVRSAGQAAQHNSGTTIVRVVGPSGGVPNVTLASGDYVMAGGGFYVCGSANLTAPHVLIYNTVYPSNPNSTGGSLGQIEFFTLGAVSVHPQTTGIYAGLTLMQDHNNVFNNAACGTKLDTSGDWDISLAAMWNGDGNGSLGAISGTVYATDSNPASGSASNGNVDDFGDAVSGTATLAIITDCIQISGADSTFNFDTGPGSLLGPTTVTLDG